jgi:hypothetical protein
MHLGAISRRVILPLLVALGVGTAVYIDPNLGTPTLAALAVASPLYALLPKIKDNSKQSDAVNGDGEDPTPIEGGPSSAGGEISGVEKTASPESDS